MNTDSLTSADDSNTSKNMIDYPVEKTIAEISTTTRYQSKIYYYKLS